MRLNILFFVGAIHALVGTASAFVAPSRIGSTTTVATTTRTTFLLEKKLASEADKNPDELVKVLYKGDSQRNLVSGAKFVRDINPNIATEGVRRRFVKASMEEAVLDDHHNKTTFIMDDFEDKNSNEVAAPAGATNVQHTATTTNNNDGEQQQQPQSLVDEMPTMTLPQLTKCLRERRMQEDKDVRRLKRDNEPLLVESKRLTWAMACNQLAELCFTKYVRDGEDVNSLVFDQYHNHDNEKKMENPTYTFLQEVASKNATSSYMDVLRSSLQTYGFEFKKITSLSNTKQMKLALALLPLDQDYQTDEVLSDMLSGDVLNGEDVNATESFAKHMEPLLATTSVRVRKQEQTQQMLALQQQLADCEAELELNHSRMRYIELARECFFQCAYETGDNVLEFGPDHEKYQSVLARLAIPERHPQDGGIFDQYLARHGLRCLQFQTLEHGGARIAVGLLPEGTYVGLAP